MVARGLVGQFIEAPDEVLEDRQRVERGPLVGLADETDITVKGLEIVKRASRVYLEAYTSILLVDKEKLVRCLFSCASAGADFLQ